MRAFDQRIPVDAAQAVMSRFQLGGWNSSLGDAKGIRGARDGDECQKCGEFPVTQAVRP